MRVSRTSVARASSAIPDVRFAHQDLTSFGGLVLLQALMQRIDLRRHLERGAMHLRRIGAYSAGQIVLLLVIHHFLGWRRLRDLDYYRHDQLVRRLIGLSQLPSVATLSRAMHSFDEASIDSVREVVRSLVATRAASASPTRLTFDVDGSVQSTKARGIEGTAIGYNKKRKGSRSYYPLFVTIAQSGQVFDFLHRPGNVHDSKGACDFLLQCIQKVREDGFLGQVEARLDSAHFSDATCLRLHRARVEFSVSVPFERIAQLKKLIEKRRTWRDLGEDWGSFERMLKPSRKSERPFRCVIYRHKVALPRQGPIQLDLFQPVQREYEYKVVLTNKQCSSRALLDFHNGRGSQEGIFAELKSQVSMEYLPSKRRCGNQLYLASCVLAHTLSREMQMLTTAPRQSVNTPKRTCFWPVQKIDTLRKSLIHQAARLTRPAGRLVLTMSRSLPIQRDFMRTLRSLMTAA